MSHATPETARRLEAAGFPRPEMQPWQVYYERQYLLFGIITDVNKGVAFSFNFLTGGSERIRYDDTERFVFAPTATDILKELGRDYNLSFMDGFWYCQYSSGDFLPFSKEPSVWKHENPAEASAMAWLQIH